MKKINNLFLNNEFIIFVIFLILIKPPSLYAIPFINSIFNILAVVLMFLIFVMYFFKRKISKLQLSIILFIGCLGISTLLRTNNYYYFIKTYSVLLAISFYSEMLILNNHKKFLKVLSILLAIYIIINFITVLFFPGGLPIPDTHEYYFLGYDNASVLTIILGLFFMIFSSYYFNKRLTLFTIIIIFISFLTYYLEWAASCLICCALVLFYILFVYKKDFLKKYINFKLLFIASILLFLFIVIFRFQNMFKWLIVDILHKSLNLTGRTSIWNRCIKQIKKHLILGIGVWDPAIRIKAMRIYHAHSTFLNILLEGGIISLLAYLNIFRIVGQRLKNFSKKNELISMCIFTLFVYFISTTIDVISDSYLLYIVLNLCYYANYINFQKRLSTKKKKILFLSGGYLPIPAILGGAVETLVTDYLDENERIYKESIDVISCQIPDGKVKKYQYSEFIYLKNKNKNCFYNVICRFSKKYLNKYVGTYFLNNAIKNINKLNREYDIIVCENEILYPIILKKHYNSKIVIHLHNNFLTPKTKFYNEIINSTDKIFAVSEYIKSQVKSNNCITVYNGIDFSLFKKEDKKVSQELRKKYNIKDNDFVFIFVGRIVPEKGIEPLINAFKNLNDKYNNIKLLVIGSPNFKGNFNQDFYNKMLSLKNENIIFTGFIDNDLLYKYYSIAHVQITPSLFEEPFGLTVIEALVMNKRVIVSDAGALPEIVNKKFGKIVSRKNFIKNLCNAMEDEYLNCYKSQVNKNELKIFSKEEYAKRVYKNLEV